MGCCSSTAAAAGEAMARGAADMEGAAMNKIHARKDNELDRKVEGIAAEGDEAMKTTKAKLKELEVATGLLADAYRPWSGMTSDQFALPSIAYWTSEPSFIGGEDAVKPTHDHAAHIAELSKLLIALRAGTFKAYAIDLAAQKTAMRKTIDAINAYYEAQLKLKSANAKLDKASTRASTKTASVRTAPPAESDAAEAAAPAAAPAEATAPSADAQPASETAAAPATNNAAPAAATGPDAEKLSKMEGDVVAAEKLVEAKRAVAMELIGDGEGKKEIEQIVKIHEHLIEERMKTVRMVAGMLADPSTAGKFEAYKPTSTITGFTDSLAYAGKALNPMDVKVDIFGKDASEHSADVEAADKQLKNADFILDLAKKQVSDFKREALKTYFAPQGTAKGYQSLIEAIADEDAKAKIKSVRPGGDGMDVLIEAVYTACEALIAGIVSYRKLIAERRADAKAYHELGKKMSSVKASIEKKEKSNKPVADAERVELTKLEESVEESFKAFDAKMKLLSVPAEGEHSFTRVLLCPLAEFTKAFQGLWKAYVVAADDLEWTYPEVPQLGEVPTPAPAAETEAPAAEAPVAEADAAAEPAAEPAAEGAPKEEPAAEATAEDDKAPAEDAEAPAEGDEEPAKSEASPTTGTAEQAS